MNSRKSQASYKDEIVRDFELDLTKDEDKDFLDDVIRYLDEKESDEAHEKAEKLIASYKDEIVRDFELDLTKDEDKDFLDDVIRYLDEKESDEAHEKAEKLIGDGWSCTSAREEVADTLDMDINDPDTQDFLDRVYEEMRNVDKDKKRIVKNRGHDLLRYGRCRRYPDDGRSGS